MLEELQIGSIGISVLLSIVLRMIYGTWEVSSKAKPWIAVGIGMGLSLVALYITPTGTSPQTVVLFLVQGFMTGATATGLYEMTRTKA
ncbi:MAG: hypothetical protein WC444_06535 [Candidatus Paceibacterota bacterium]